MTEYIKKSDAIEVIQNAETTDPAYHYYKNIAVEQIEDLPAAEVVHIETYRELYEKYVELKHASEKAVAVLAEKLQGEKDGPKKSSDREKIYIAGPVTGVEGYEAKFERAADELRAKGYEPVNPVGPGLVEGWTYRDYINRGFEMLMDCDGILLLPGFMESKGAALELHYALAVGMEPLRWSD